MPVAIVAACRGDPACILHQLRMQGVTTIAGYTLVFVGPIFGSYNLTCTPKKHAKEHPDTVIAEFILNAARSKTCTIRIVPAHIDNLLLSGKGDYLLGGSSKQKATFFRIVRSNQDVFSHLCVASMKSPSIVRSSEHTESSKKMLQYIPKMFWPSAFIINGHLTEPLWAAAYRGKGGMDLHGILADSLSEALRTSKGERSVFVDSFGNLAKTHLHDYLQEPSALKDTCSNCVHITEVYESADENVNWAWFKKQFLDRYGPDITKRIGVIRKSEIYKMLDDIMNCGMAAK